MINTLISSSVLILIILAIRFIFKGKINPVVQYGLWGLVALRLAAASCLSMYPVKSALSVMNAIGSLSEFLHSSAATEQVLTGTAQAGAMENAVFIMDNVKTGIVVSGGGISPAVSIDWQLVILVIWAIGTLAMGLWLIFVNLGFGRKIVESRTLLMSAEVTRNGEANESLPVYISESPDSPCLMRYRGETAIYVTPEVAADEAKLRYAVTHELCHYQHHDLIWAVVRGALLAIYWFNPLVWAAAVMSRRDCELACDYAVIKEIGTEDRFAYGKALVDLISGGRQKSHVLHMSTTMYGGAKGIKERVVMIARNKKMKASTLAAVLLIVALSAGCTFTAASDVMRANPEDEKSSVSESNTPNDSNIDGKYLWPVTGYDHISSAYGTRIHPIKKEMGFHDGIDIPAPEGTPVLAADKGTVTEIGDNETDGNYVILNHGGDIQTFYAQLLGFAEGLAEGDTLQQGDVIGYVGATGEATGNHLHFGLTIDSEYIDPMSVFTQEN